MRADHRPGRRAGRWLAGVLVGLAGVVAAAGDWSTLSTPQRQLLAPFETVWPQLPDAQRAQILANAERWQRLDPLQQARLQQRLQQWLALPAAERHRLRAAWAHYRLLPDARRQALHAVFASYTALPPEQRAIRQQAFAALPPAERDAWRLGDADRELHLLAGRLFAYVPAAEQQATLAMLAEFDDEQRAELTRAAQRMAPWQRDALRIDLLAAAPSARAALLAERLR